MDAGRVAVVDAGRLVVVDGGWLVVEANASLEADVTVEVATWPVDTVPDLAQTMPAAAPTIRIMRTTSTTCSRWWNWIERLIRPRVRLALTPASSVAGQQLPADPGASSCRPVAALPVSWS